MEVRRTNTGLHTKNIIRIVLVTVLVPLAPLLAMRFTNEVNWSLTDFAVAGALLIGTGLMYELVVKKLSNTRHRVALGIVLVAALLLIWIELAVGLFGTPFSGS